MEDNNKILIYTDSKGLTKIDVKLEEDTLWLTQAQMCELYQTSRTNVVEHIKHIYEEGELIAEATCRKFRQVREEGNRKVERVSHANAMEHATYEYCKYKQRTISDVEQDYLNSIKRIGNMDKKGGHDED